MDRTEISKLAALEDTHWWYRERRHLVCKGAQGLAPGVALDIGAAGGGNTRVLRGAGWQAVAVEYDESGAAIAASRAVPAVCGDARRLPFADGSADLVVAFDVLEHIVEEEDAVAEMRRVLRPGGRLLVAVPADESLWSAHDEAVGHVRRYDRAGIRNLLERGGFTVEELRAWNVLLRPAVKWRRRKSRGSDLTEVSRSLNAVLGAVVRAERVLPVGQLPGVSLLAVAQRSA